MPEHTINPKKKTGMSVTVETGDVDTVRIEDRSVNSGKGDDEKMNTPPRPTTQTNLSQTKKLMPGVVVSGHPKNYFNSIFRLSKGDKYFRALDVMPVKNGGLIVQSSWLEDGKPALSFFYDPCLHLEERTYRDNDGNKIVGYIIADQRNRLFRLAAGCVLLASMLIIKILI